MDARTLAIQYHRNARSRSRAELSSVQDVRVVTGVDGSMLTLVPIGGGAPAQVPTATHVHAEIGDEVVVTRLGAGYVVTANLRTSAEAQVFLGKPIIVEPVIRDAATAAFLTWDSTTGADVSSLKRQVTGLDQGTTYVIEAEAGAYLGAAVAGTKVRLGLRIGYPTDPASIHPTAPWGAGHTFAVETWCRAVFARIVSGATAMNINARVIASAAGTNTIGDGDLHVRMFPLLTTGGS